MNSRQNNSRNGRFIPRVESLEDRTVPAGNVQVVVGDGILYVAGDDAANQIWIAGAGKNAVVIRSLDDTTINGKSSPLFVGGIDRGYYVRMYGGNDQLIINGTRSNGALDVGMGDGDDVLGISDAGHRKETVLNLDGGNDTLNLHASPFRKAVFTNSGAGSDQVNAAQIGVMDFYMINPAGNDFFDNQGSTIGRPNMTGFAVGQRPDAPVTPPAPPAPPPVPDTTAPVTAFALLNDTGVSNTDKITNDSRINVTLTDASAITRLRAGFDTSVTTGYTDVLANLANGTLSLTTSLINTINGGSPLSEGSHTLFLDVADEAGNSSLGQFTFTVDTVAPGEPIYDLAPLSDTGITGDLRTDNDTVTLAGTAEPGITLQLSRATVPGTPGTAPVIATTTANSSGQFIFNNVALNVGPNSFVVRAVDVAGNIGGTLAQTFTRNTAPTVNTPIDPQTATVGGPALTFDLGNDGTGDVFVDAEIVVRLATTYPTGQTGNIDINLFPDQASNTVANFLSYVNNTDPAGNYNNSVFHRLQTGFVLQGGGFKFDENGTTVAEVFPSITTVAPVANQPGISNTRGTIAMAKFTADDATSQFFFNLEDNSVLLDTINNAGGFTVFGQVMSGTQNTIDNIDDLTVFDSGTPPFRQLPTRPGADTNPFPADLTAADVAIITTATQLNGAQRMSFLVIGNTNEGAVTTSIDANTGILTVTPVAVTTDPVTITVRATDLDGSQTTTSFTVTVN